ncbi:glycogen synthase GlgA [Rhizobium sp. TH2]|uniref:glycogen synthase GlgA n=1 Tax=Rhizobium sp. TH2 TaxID=2775403 RepID=UPI002157B067|nr:glycogen synthase GlgA [Rhizobium sp. TH2]UVC07811.1 glycogen synthase GlgA [Rhizobium sp. TH2]
MKVLSVASEVFPLIKTGGLADVAGALPIALAPLGIDMRTLLPGYTSVLAKLGTTRIVCEIPDLLGQPATLLFAEHAGLPLYVIDCPEFYDRDGGPYVDTDGKDYIDNWQRFAALSRVASDLANGIDPDWAPDIVHGHDWQAGLAPVYLKYSEVGPHTPSVLTIHNIAFQGQFSAQIFPALDLPLAAYTVDGVEYYSNIGYLKGGLRTAWALTTVSPTYAEEILEPQFGMGLEGLIGERVADLVGIVNGIDDDVWNPETDKHIAATYNGVSLKRRRENRLALIHRFGLIANDGPIFCVVSRLTWQKGIDLIIEAADEIVAHGGKLAVLGSGDPVLEEGMLAAAARHPGSIGVVFGYDEPLSHLMQAGSDVILIPSRFEPCGLTQLYGLRYGCVPVVGKTGGLADTIIDANGAALTAKVATGIQFSPIDRHGLSQALRRTFRLFEDDAAWNALQKAAMKSDVSWQTSASQYANLYKTLINRVAVP